MLQYALGISKVDDFHGSPQTKQCPWIHYFNNHNRIKSFLDQSIMACNNLKKSIYALLRHHFMCCHWDPTRSKVVISIILQPNKFHTINNWNAFVENTHFVLKFEIMPKKFMFINNINHTLMVVYSQLQPFLLH
jgi:hypothetical protein